MEYIKKTGYFYSETDNCKLFYRIWEAEKFSPDKCIVVCHGYGEYSDRYENLATGLKDTGYSLYALDLRGHGQSGQEQGVSPGLMQFVTDLQTFIDFVSKNHAVKKPVLLGHSFGALVVILFVLQPGNESKIRLLITNGSPMKFIMTFAMKMKKTMANLVSGIYPNLKVHITLDGNFISHDPQEVFKYKNDPLIHDITTIKVANEVLEYIPWCFQKAPDMKIPVLFTHGGNDKISDPEGTVNFYNACGSPDKTLIIYDGFFHEVYNEVEKEKAFKDIREWIKKRS